MEQTEDTADLHTQIFNLQAELDSLRARYDTLLEAKTRAAERYKADYKKWRDFKQFLFKDIETDDQLKSFLKSGKLNAHAKASTLGKRKHFEDFGSDLEHAFNEDVDEAKSPGLREVTPGPAAVTPRNQRRKSYHGERILWSSPRSNIDRSSVSRSTNDFVPDNKFDVPCKAKSPPPIPATEPRKGRGRYAQVSSGLGTINSRFSIRKDKNDGVDFQYDAVIRNREERKHMLGSDCECCREYYEAVGPLPASRQPLWRTPTKGKIPHSLHASDDKENTDEVDRHKQQISRHRHHWHRPKTPPGYWDIGFPDTQEVLDINRRAAEMHKRKFVEVEAEARNNKGRYVERTPRTP